MKAPTRRPRKKEKEDSPKEQVQKKDSAPDDVVHPEKSTQTPKPKKKRKTKKEKIEEEIANAKLEYKGPPYVLHEIECLCISRVQKAMAGDAHGRRFDVFSLVDENGEIIPSTVQCEDCGRKWDVLSLDDYDMAQIDKMPTYTRKRLQRILPKDLVNACEEWKVSTALMAYMSWVIEEKKWGTQIIVNRKKYRREDISYDTRILIIEGPINFKIKEMQASNIAELW